MASAFNVVRVPGTASSGHSALPFDFFHSVRPHDLNIFQHNMPSPLR